MIPEILNVLGGFLPPGIITGFDRIREVLERTEVENQTFILLEEALFLLPKKILEHILLEKRVASGYSHLVLYCHESRLFVYIFCGDRSKGLGLPDAMKTMFCQPGNTLRSMEHVLSDDYWGNEIRGQNGELRLELDRYTYSYKKEVNALTEGAVCERSRDDRTLKHYLEVSFTYSELLLFIP